MLGQLWNNPKTRSLLLQALLLLSLLAIASMMLINALDNLATRGITTGFDFLSETAGFGIPQTLIEYSEASSYARTFWVGLLNTLLVSVLGIVAATLLGFTLGITRLSHNWLLAKLSSTYIEVFRNLPLLLQIFFWYFAVLQTLPSPRQSYAIGDVFLNIRGLYLPAPVVEPGFIWVAIAMLFALLGMLLLLRHHRRLKVTQGDASRRPWLAGLGIALLPVTAYFISGQPLAWQQPQLSGFNFQGGMVLLPELVALWLALTIYTAAFIAETVRAGLLSVPKGQLEAAASLGLPRSKIVRLVVMPQALRVIIPPLTSQYLNLIKNSSLATAIGYPDLVAVFAGTTLNQTGQAIEVISMTMAVYLTFSLLTSLLMNRYNRHVSLVER